MFLLLAFLYRCLDFEGWALNNHLININYHQKIFLSFILLYCDQSILYIVIGEMLFTLQNYVLPLFAVMNIGRNNL